MIRVVSPHLPAVEEVLRNQARPGSGGMAPLLHSIFTRGVPRNPAQHSTQLPDNLGDGPQSPPTPPTPIHPILRRSLD